MNSKTRQVKNQDHFVAPYDAGVSFDELPDSAPSSRYKPSPTGWIGMAIVGFWVTIAITGPFIAPYGENDLPFPDAYSEFQLPQPGAWLGTDVSDRDILSRLMYGAGRTIGISFAATILAYMIGVVLGIGAAISGPKVDMVLSRINDAFLSLPTIMLGLVVVAALGSSIPLLICTAGVIYATVIFRLARALGQEIMVMDFVEAAKVRGEGRWWIITREIWPNAAMPLMTDFGLRLIYVILFISSLSFLGLGVQPPQADWGSMVRENLGALQYGVSIIPVIAPALSIATLTVAINLVVDDVSAHSGGKLSKRL
ncbi:MAG: DNA-directed RNA polymerase subunit alpha [SAR116 cluster bacterium MED-G04]|jgi:peptide/nickel transport system permease protein|nr:DNA-directed RNA polymerase subunit alpha [SAR116 cluster bacterium]PDH63080.1 MAG: DNA-directed RNA polymerase subunit alpha [SAR116 cluster bacterium MED-G04]CAI8354548.1 MAG: putative D,D-dipeptide transport system permease protein DdpC [SAR116 cluster bacterium MED-G04]HCD49286.1 DNA-directed RNA polymerase subunit alpha [Alphaproteobacteria bacterium]|tara:strand:- start:889 stop:1824 length:936 start_codon:yes stop_codon:yes gene_type:complete